VRRFLFGEGDHKQRTGCPIRRIDGEVSKPQAMKRAMMVSRRSSNAADNPFDFVENLLPHEVSLDDHGGY
jgi:hypothetical protein